MDFVHDQLATGRKLRVLTIIDTFPRFSPAIEPLGSTSAALMLWKYLRRSAGKSDSRKQSGSIKAQSSCHAISTSGLISAVSLRPGEGPSNAKPPVPPIDEQYRRRL